MGTGKTTISKIISKNLRMKLVDTDKLIEKKEEMKIHSIFQIYGEDYFRALEKDTVKTLCKQNGLVISTGGGIVLDSENVNCLRESGVAFLLNGSIETIISNLQRSATKRPLLNMKNWENRASELLEKRKELYLKSCDYVIDINNRQLRDISYDIIAIYKKYCNNIYY